MTSFLSDYNLAQTALLATFVLLCWAFWKKFRKVERAEPSSVFVEDHEVELDVPETGVKNCRFESCKKNPGHTKMFLVRHVTIDDLPEDWQYPDLFTQIMETSRMVVKVTVSYVSPNRPRRYPGYQQRGKSVSSTGTGTIMLTPEVKNAPNIDCPLKNCQIEKAHQTTPKFKVHTSTHVVYDDMEAKNTTVEFFLDSGNDVDKNVVKCQGVEVLATSQNTDCCQISCVSHDLNLFQKIETLPPYVSLVDAMLAPTPPPSRRPREPLVVIISHPHGHFKHVAFGTWVGYAKMDTEIPDMKLQDWLNNWLEKERPRWRETGYSDSVDGPHVHAAPQMLEKIAQAAMLRPEAVLSEFPQERCRIDRYKSLTYSTATCPGSSGARVSVFLPGEGAKPWVWAGVSTHFRRFDDTLNASGSPLFLQDYAKEVKKAISGRRVEANRRK